MGLARGAFQIRPRVGAENPQEQVPQLLRRRDGSAQDLADLLLHGYPMPGRAGSKPFTGLVVDSADAQTGQRNLRKTRPLRLAHASRQAPPALTKKLD